MPRSIAWRIVATDSASSCGPHPYDHPPPPIAQDPNPTVVILSPLEPSRRVGNAMLFSFFYRTNFIVRMKHLKLRKIPGLTWQTATLQALSIILQNQKL